MKPSISSIYLLKAVGAVFVVMVHFHFYRSQVFEPLYRCGVPIFFILGGYFLFTPDNEILLSRIKRSLLKMIKLIIFFNTIYYFVNSTFVNDWSFEFSNNYKLFRLLIYGDSISGHLWFLHSYLWTILLLWFLANCKVKFFVYNVLAVLLLILCCFNGSYGFILPFDLNVSKFWFPWVLMSYPMFIVGFNIHKYEENILSYFSSQIVSFGLLICILLCYIEHRLFSMLHLYTADTKLSTLLLVSMLLIFCLTKKEFGKGTWLETLGRDHSANIYFWQFIPSIAVCPIVDILGLQDIIFFIMFGVLVLWSYGVNFINNKIRSYLHY